MKNDDENKLKADNISNILIKANSQSSTSSKKNQNKCAILVFKVLLGQMLALLSVSNCQLSKKIENTPAKVFPCLMNGGYYFLFGVFWLIYLRKLTMPKVSVFFIVFFDAQANYLRVYSYSNCRFNYFFIVFSSSVFFICIFDFIFNRKHHYSLWRIAGALLALIGISLTLYGAIMKYPSLIEEIHANYIGLGCSLGSAICYSISIVIMNRFFSSGKDIYDAFPWMGICGTILSLCQSFLLNEYSKVIQKEMFHWSTLIFYGSFLISMITLNSISPFFIRKTSAGMFNLSITSQILWSYLGEVVLSNEITKSYWYYAGLGVVIAGIIPLSHETTNSSMERQINKVDGISEEILKQNLLSSTQRTDSMSE